MYNQDFLDVIVGDTGDTMCYKLGIRWMLGERRKVGGSISFRCRFACRRGGGAEAREEPCPWQSKNAFNLH
jgi:hypothetical protein